MAEKAVKTWETDRISKHCFGNKVSMSMRNCTKFWRFQLSILEINSGVKNTAISSLR